MAAKLPPDLSRISQLIPHAQSTIESYQLLLQSGRELRESNAIHYDGSLVELRDMLQTLLSNGPSDPESFQVQLNLLDKISELLDSSEGEEDNLGQDSLFQSSSHYNTVDTHEILSLIEIEQEQDINVPIEPFTCPVCFVESLPEEGFMFEACFDTYCRECLNTHLTIQITEGKVHNIVCPDNNCKSAIIVTDIQKLVSPELFSKFEKFSLLASLRANPNVKWCPTADCNFTSSESRNEDGLINCEECKRIFCFDCSNLDHSGMTCTEAAISRGTDDLKTQKWKKKHGVKACPHCGTETTRKSGCPAMICISCNQNWSWHYDTPDKWDELELSRKDETKLETAAFFYPRIVKQSIGSRELLEDGETTETVLGLAIFGIVGVPATIICGIPAVALKSGRGVKNLFKRKN